MERKNEFYLEIDYKSPIPVYEQIKRSIILMITTKDLSVGEKLPPIRELAKILKVNHNTIVKVYYQIEQEGFIYSKPGTGYFVSEIKPAFEEKQKAIFKKITEEFIHLSLKLGYSIPDIILEIEEFKKNE